jgi:hypothetical protein
MIFLVEKGEMYYRFWSSQYLDSKPNTATELVNQNMRK